MMINEHISTELIQLFSVQEADRYQIIPYAKDGLNISCYGKAGVVYANILDEVSMIYGYNIRLTLLQAEEFDRKMSFYYRPKAGEKMRVNISQIGQAGFINALLAEAEALHASDIHIEAFEMQCRVRMRIDGKLIERYIIAKADYPALVNKIKIIANLDISEKRLPQDGRIYFEQDSNKFDIRVSILPAIYGEKVVMRLLTRNANLLNLDLLGMTPRQLSDYRQATQSPNGLVLITGPTGSGKSTTLYATLQSQNRIDNNILTIEDPVEYTLPGINQVQLKEEIGLTFGNALRTFLRQDPDIIMLGEIRDIDTAQMAIRSSLTGHLLLSTIHTNSAWGVVSRLTDMGIQPYLIADTLVASVAQRLVRLLCPKCKTVDTATGYYHAVGCPHCYYTGYSGRRAIYQVILMDNYLAECIRQGNNDIEKHLRKRGITSLSDTATEMVKRGETTEVEVYSILNGIM